jgi:tetratricopeptide (TPR) repeat protein
MVPVVAIVGLGMTAAPARAQAAASPTDRIAEAYTQFLLAQRFEDDDDADGAIAAYRRAMALDPQSADIVAELANLYMRQNRSQDATTAAESALKIDPKNSQAHLVLGTIYATLASQGDNADNAPGAPSPAARNAQRANLKTAIQHLEQSIADPIGLPDANTRAMLSRLYMTDGD